MMPVALPQQPAVVARVPAHVRGCLVHDGEGSVLGSIAELVPDPARGGIAYALVASGGFLGVGERHFTVPWGALHRQGREFVLAAGHVASKADGAPVAARHAPARPLGK